MKVLLELQATEEVERAGCRDPFPPCSTPKWPRNYLHQSQIRGESPRKPAAEALGVPGRGQVLSSNLLRKGTGWHPGPFWAGEKSKRGHSRTGQGEQFACSFSVWHQCLNFTWSHMTSFQGSQTCARLQGPPPPGGCVGSGRLVVEGGWKGGGV